MVPEEIKQAGYYKFLSLQRQDGAKQHNAENGNISNENNGNNEDENEDESNKNCVRTRSGRIVKRPNYLKDYT